jgi:hypothetical protein
LGGVDVGEGRHEGVWYEGEGDDGGGWWRLVEGGAEVRKVTTEAETEMKGGGRRCPNWNANWKCKWKLQKIYGVYIEMESINIEMESINIEMEVVKKFIGNAVDDDGKMCEICVRFLRDF